MLRGDHAGGPQKSAQEHYRSDHPREAFKLHIVFEYWDHPRREDCSCQGTHFCTCPSDVCQRRTHLYEGSDAHLLDVTIFINGHELRVLPERGASSIDDVTDLIYSDDDSTGLGVDFMIAEKVYQLQYFLDSSGLSEVGVVPYTFQGHIDHSPILSDAAVCHDLVIEARFAGEPVQRYYSEGGGHWVKPDNVPI